jgi:hypothetical protein
MTVTVEVKCDDEDELYWRKTGTPTWAQLTALGGPVIEEISSGHVTFEFVKHSGSTYGVYYKENPNDTPQSLPTSGGPTVVVGSGDRNQVHFAQGSGGPYFSGSVTVSDDG